MQTLSRSLVLCSLLIAGSAARADSLVLAPSAKEIKPLGVGATAPALTLKTFDNANFDLGKALAEKPTVVIIFRGGWCPYCSRQLGELAALEPKLLALGFQIIAISTDRATNLRSVAEGSQVNYLLLSDRLMDACSAFGVAYRVSPEMQKKYSAWNIDVPAVPGDSSSCWLPVPAAFVIGRDRVIKFAYTNPDYTVRISSEKLLQAAQDALK